jgi:hypothetical protein
MVSASLTSLAAPVGADVLLELLSRTARKPCQEQPDENLSQTDEPSVGMIEEGEHSAAHQRVHGERTLGLGAFDFASGAPARDVLSDLMEPLEAYREGLALPRRADMSWFEAERAAYQAALSVEPDSEERVTGPALSTRHAPSGCAPTSVALAASASSAGQALLDSAHCVP